MRGVLLASLMANLGTNSVWAAAGPLQVRNQMPVAQLYGLPRPLGADLSQPGTRVGLGLEITNNFSDKTSAADAVVHDGETYLTTLSVSRSLGAQRRFEVGVEVPYLHHTDGHLDGFIDGFHDVFGLPDAGRSDAPRNVLDYQVIVDGATYADFQRSKGHLGDVRAWFGYQALRSADSTLALRGMVKFPTGTVDSLTGSEGADFAIWAEYANSHLLRALRLEMSLMAGAVLLGDGDLAPSAQRDVAGFFHFGLQLPLGKRVRLHGQLDAHTELVDSAVKQIGGSALQGTLGGRIELSQRFWLDLGVVENLTTKSAPDVTFQIVLGGRFR